MRKCAILAAAAFAAVTVIGGAGSAVADPSPGAYAEGASYKSPGVLSGNVLQVPVDVPVNACGNSLDVVGILNPASGAKCH